MSDWSVVDVDRDEWLSASARELPDPPEMTRREAEADEHELREAS